MPHSKSQTKRRRELAKLNKRQAKDQKRALRKAERSAGDASTPAAVVPAIAAPDLRIASGGERPPAATRQPLTLAEAVERWKKMKVPNTKRR